MMNCKKLSKCTTALYLAFVGAFANATEVQVAVAANFYKPMLAIAQMYEADSQHKVSISVGSTGKLYAQIANGAPFDLFFAADQLRPSKLVELGLAEPNSQQTYALGRLVLWSKQSNLVDNNGAVLNSENFNYLAICNPKTAPYGAAALSTLTHVTLLDSLQSKLVEGQSVGQTFQQVSSGAAELGFVALSQVLNEGKLESGSMWLVPDSFYKPIKQDLVLLNRAADNPAVVSLMAFMNTPKVNALIKQFGYGLPAHIASR
ncbi:molybdate ABC transporter substrate-binding protein [Agarivorans aestuarii]|uniref:Molybdate ABC transporter substrate-binding protein n=1 Tax=Agarivorans aestuarii TaxID=1563703 RepID=A0ABU7G1I9_9ALTE|nr:molybdate ABC transporter substrate-binding protein [Agarivorans aestuarii]MEE1673272.1 molybdate ABC transporter substrate-binding protein [Agarivorans aestuarii]